MSRPHAEPTDEQSVRLLFEGGARAVAKDNGRVAWELPISGEPPQSIRIRVQTQHKDPHACVAVTTTDHSTLLLVVHDALIHADPMLRSTKWWEWNKLDVDSAMDMMRSRVTRKNEMAIFAFSNDASESGRMLMRRVMLTLHDLRITAQQPHKDAHVVVVQGEKKALRMWATTVTSLIGNVRPPDLRLREIGNPVSRATPVAKKPKLGDRGPVRLAPVGPLAELPKRPGQTCTVS